MEEPGTNISRRTFLKWSGASAATLTFGQVRAQTPDAAQQLGAEDASATTGVPKDAPAARILLHEADGSPLGEERAATLIARDLANDPLPQGISSAEGRARVALAKEPIQIAVRLKVPGFGEVYCYADNDGRGFAKPINEEFVALAARTRLRRVREAAQQARAAGVPADLELDRQLQAAARSIPKKPGVGQIAAAYETLSHGLHAGERLTLNWARHRIRKLAKPRHEFLFGGLASGWQRGADYEQKFKALFNYAVTSWYTWSSNAEPPEQRIDYARMDQSVDWCLRNGLTAKSFGYVYMARGATPEWIRSWPFEKLLPAYKSIVANTTRRFHGRVPMVEVMNEAHDKANLFRLSHTQVLEFAREACRAAREGSPTVKRLLNHCCLWAEYAKRANEDRTHRWSPFRFLKDCVSAGVEFDVVGLQLYYPQHDLFEIDRMLDRFKAFNRPIHITELGCNSVDGLDTASMRPNSLVPGWHGPWNETIQADWAEAIYTLCYSKPEFEAVGWWDFADVGGHFWPSGGLLHKDLSPKESYQRLLKLKEQWGVGKNSLH